MEEIWKPVLIDELRERYEVSNLGNVRRTQHATITRNGAGVCIKHYCTRNLKLHINKLGYVRLNLVTKDGKQRKFAVHRLVAQSFLPNPDNLPVVDHIDTNPSNNVVSNLRWCTYSDNIRNPITIAKKREIMMGNQHTKGWHPNDEQRRRMSIASTGRKYSRETIEKRRLAMLGRKVSDKVRYAKAKKVAQLSLCGDIIKTWESVADAAREMGTTVSTIAGAANPHNPHKTALGYVWKYL